MDSPGLHLTDPDWNAAALQAVVDLGGGLARTVCIARALVDNGRTVDLAGLDRGVGLFCAKALDLPYEQGQGVRVHLLALLAEIDRLTEALHRREGGPRGPGPAEARPSRAGTSRARTSREQASSQKKAATMTLSGLLYAGVALLGVLLLVVLAGRAARASGLVKRAAGNRIQVEETLAIDPRRRLLLVRCDGRRLLLLTGPQDLALGWLSEASGDAPAGPPAVTQTHAAP